MENGTPARILLCADEAEAVSDVRLPLEDAGYALEFSALDGEPPSGGFALAMLDGSAGAERALELCRHLRRCLADTFVPILFVTGDHSPQARLASLECGADTYLLRPFVPGELLAQVQALLRIKDRHDHLAEKSAEVQRMNKRLQSAYQHIDKELELARRIQESFLPQTLPELPRVQFAVHYQPCAQVGGDFYDIFRLDEHHLALYVADAMGHGVPASLLTVFVKKGVKAKEINGHDYRLVPPGEVLGRLNRDLIEQALSETPFITMIYGLFNSQEVTFSFARSGHPYPLYVPREGPPRLWQIEGSLLGVFDTVYPVQTHALGPGDKLLLYTDGMDAAGFQDHPVGVASLIAATDRFRHLGIQDLVPRLAHDLFTQTKQTDDLTLVGLEVKDDVNS